VVEERCTVPEQKVHDSCSEGTQEPDDAVMGISEPGGPGSSDDEANAKPHSDSDRDSDSDADPSESETSTDDDTDREGESDSDNERDTDRAHSQVAEWAAQRMGEGGGEGGVSVLTYVIGLVKWGQKNRIPVKAMRSLFFVLQATQPEVPPYDTCVRVLRSVGVGSVQVYDVCLCGDAMYRDTPAAHDPRGEHQHLRATACPACGVTRSAATTTKYTHLGLVKQLAQVFWDPAWRAAAALPRGRADGETMDSIHDSPAWQQLVRDDPQFAAVATNIVGAYSTDGVNPYKHSNHSMWPQLWKVLNYGPRDASRTALVIMFGLVHGPSSPTSLQAVLRLLVEELHVLWLGVPVAHPTEGGRSEVMRAVLMLVVGDYPALSKGRQIDILTRTRRHVHTVYAESAHIHVARAHMLTHA
jgi:hypothetical protein